MSPTERKSKSTGFRALMVAAIAIAIASIAYQSLTAELVHAERETNLLKQWSSPGLPPWPVFIVVNVVHTVLTMLDPLRYIAPHQLFEICSSNVKHAVLAVAVRYDLAEVLAPAPLSAGELANVTNLDPNRLGRVMEILVLMRVFEKTADNKYRNTEMSALLRESHPNSMQPFIAHATDLGYGPMGLLWEQLPVEQATAKSKAYEQYWGMEFFPHLASQPSKEKRFIKAMTALDNIGAVPVVEDFPWELHKRVVDVGGASGSISRKIVAKYPHLKALVFDRPSVIDGRTNASNQEFVAGDFFKPETLPDFQDGDVILLKNILHDWDYDASLQILTNLRSRSTGKRVVIAVVEGSPVETSRSFGQFVIWIHQLPVLVWRKRVFDMFMLVMGNGYERSVEELQDLLKVSGWKPVEAIPTRSHVVITTGENF